MKVNTRVFSMYEKHYKGIKELSAAMGIPESHLTDVRDGREYIDHKFVVGATRAFPQYNLGDMFYLSTDTSTRKT